MNSNNNQNENKEVKKTILNEVEDIISIGALLRPTLVSAVSNLNETQIEELKEILISAEKELSCSDVAIKNRFLKLKNIFERTYKFESIWRFIATRIEETWSSVGVASVKELSIVSLILGILIEETQARLQVKTKKRKSA